MMLGRIADKEGLSDGELGFPEAQAEAEAARMPDG